ncbi:spore germination protein [Pseudalkalibacillus decolorationis]|uniref:spore germination protein n=1 Tax=Pseudalkalibacillus decolorationis TaxID=163879 RepID=UPI0021487E93|nr:spore germination protein [Pseudalkalibacillus decolorationis]
MVAMILSGIVLTITIMIEIAVLGVYGLSTDVFPFLILVEKLNLGEFIQGLEVIAMVVLIIGGFFKVTVFTYAAVISATDLFKGQNHRKFVLPIGVMIFITSMITSDSFVEHINQGKIVLKTIFPLFEFVIPLLLMIVFFIRQRIKQQ